MGDPVSSAQRAADYESVDARRWVQLALGLIWLVDALLQFQPYMFTRALATQVMEPAAAGNPGFVAGPLLAAARIAGHDPVASNAVFATIQLAIGLGLLWRRTVRAALVASIIWGLLVWWLGEGLGGILAGNPTPVTGAPGAAVLYELITGLAWPPGRRRLAGGSAAGGSGAGGSGACDGPLGDWARPAWLAVWGSGAYFLLLTVNQAPSALGSSLASAAAGEPAWLAALDHSAAVAVGARGTAVSLGLAAVFTLIAFGVFTPALSRPLLVLAMVTAMAIWLLGEDLGGILAGNGTDPNTGPLLVLLAMTYWPQPAPSRRPSFAAQGRPDNRLADTTLPSAQIRPGRHRVPSHVPSHRGTARDLPPWDTPPPWPNLGARDSRRPRPTYRNRGW